MILLKDGNIRSGRHTSSSPPGQEERKTDSLKDAGQSTNGNDVKWALLSDESGDDLNYVVSILRHMT